MDPSLSKLQTPKPVNIWAQKEEVSTVESVVVYPKIEKPQGIKIQNIIECSLCIPKLTF